MVPAVSGLEEIGLSGMSLDQVANLGFLKLSLRPGQMVGNEVQLCPQKEVMTESKTILLKPST